MKGWQGLDRHGDVVAPSMPTPFTAVLGDPPPAPVLLDASTERGRGARHRVWLRPVVRTRPADPERGGAPLVRVRCAAASRNGPTARPTRARAAHAHAAWPMRMHDTAVATHSGTVTERRLPLPSRRPQSSEAETLLPRLTPADKVHYQPYTFDAALFTG